MPSFPTPHHDSHYAAGPGNHWCGIVQDDDGGGLLDQVHRMIADRQVWRGMEILVKGLNETLRQSTELEWEEYVQQSISHPLVELVQQDPLTHGASCSRGYPDLLELIRSIEGDGAYTEAVSWTGGQIFEFLMASTLCRGAVSRAWHVVEAVSRVANSREFPQILAVNSGYLREADLVDQQLAGRIGRWLAYHPDRQVVDRAQDRYSHLPVEIIAGNTERLLGSETSLGEFDLIYSMGGLEDLSQPDGLALVRELFGRLRSGGELLVTNLAADSDFHGYAACYMNWRPILRDDCQMRELAADIPVSQIAHSRLFGDDTQTVLMLSLVRG